MSTPRIDSLLKKIAKWMVIQLKTLQDLDGSPLFKNADIWKFQIDATKGGAAKFTELQPFAFVDYDNGDSAREGGRELRQVPTMKIFIGIESKSDGDAFWGTDKQLGTSDVRDMIIDLFDNESPDTTINNLKCDEMFYINDHKEVIMPRQSGLELTFEISSMGSAKQTS